MNYIKNEIKNCKSVEVLTRKTCRHKHLGNKKKEGFTLIEVIAVIAIIGILAVIILPKVTGYIKEAKKVKVVDQCRKVVMAVESYNLRHDPALSDSVAVGSIITNKGVSKYLEGVDLNNLNVDSTSIKNCYDILNGAEFDLADDTDVLNPSTISKSTDKDNKDNKDSNDNK
ncbi:MULTISPECIES: prepilin-type N-terminal cleavage/methylation domain-containing protein [unclassified Clostridium]|uniref:prepilin-type N-terminal cleavage/methylation domain-containing protein n=1 Tax=unclassified Clostridium TaxID=2614128 RepID=UPI00029790DC|nr:MULTISPECIES: prepilin-type N-terminal cleavage/methylation domain-containing protein [unclassified Clostridium]EKQ51815.1 MAG: prepilin-type N-terminal cleavage/methylation domain-containing protein [Clostridium sp. Maddingley MBC34-26]